MSKKLTLAFLFLISFFLRFWELGEIPEGISVTEAKFGLTLSSMFGDWVLSPFFVRLPNAVLSLFSLFLFFYTLLRLKRNFEFAVLGSAALAITPWHVMESRIASAGIIVLVVFMFCILLVNRIAGSEYKKIGILLTLISIFIFLASILIIKEESRSSVNVQRILISKQNIPHVITLLSNKFIESYRYRERLLFENLDFGNYFFKGYPRQRWGLDEAQKFFIVFLPFLIIGIFKIEKGILWFLGGYSFLTLSLLVFFEKRDLSFTLPLTFPLIFTITEGVTFLEERLKFKWFWFLFLAFLTFESLGYYRGYFKGYEEGQFSPRRPVYMNLVPDVLLLRRENEDVFVSERMKDPKIFFQFYSSVQASEQFHYESFDVRKIQGKEGLFVDVLPDDPSPIEPLYKKNGNWPEFIEFLDEFRDEGLRQTVVVYRLK